MTKKMKKSEIRQAFAEIFSFASKKDRIDHHERMIMFRFLHELQGLMEELGMNKRELAQRIGTSASYITQLFRGDKVINLHMLGKIEVEFDRCFDIKLVDKNNERVLEVDEDEVIKFLNKKYAHDGCWIFHNYKQPAIPLSITYSEQDESQQVDSISNG